MDHTKNRWQLAQDYEKDWWVSRAEELDLEFYERFARDLVETLKPFLSITEETYVLEIGSGAAGILTYLKSNHRFAIDPLESVYASIEKFASARDKSVVYKEAMAEKLPFENNLFDLIIIDNVLDHCEDPKKVLSEMNRVMKKNGKVYFRQNTYHTWGKLVRKLIEFFKIDRGHPHTFTKSELSKLFNRNGFQILHFQNNGYYKTWLREIKSSRLYDKIKALIFATRDKTLYVLNKTEELKAL
jgi:ubiquinone/menaquinone biosynthesis C-methylase UbiE